MSKIFVTSNTYFGRDSIIKSRKFNNITEMNDKLIENWNSVVSANDTVYHLGNYAWEPMIAEDILLSLNGKIKFIIGEFDQPLLDMENFLDPNKCEVLQRDFIYIEEYEVLLTHWPLLRWPGMKKNVVQLCGTEYKFKSGQPSISVSQDIWGLKPVNIDTAIDILTEVNNQK